MKLIIDIFVSANPIPINRFVFSVQKPDVTDNEVTVDPKWRPIAVRSDFCQTLYFIRELTSSSDYRHLVFNNLWTFADKSGGRRVPAVGNGLTSTEDTDQHCRVISLRVNLLNTDHLLAIDKNWNGRILRLVTIRVRLEDSLSWLSTLGGAYSSLGEYDINCAVKAGQISVSQLGLAVATGDPNLVAKCGIYMAYSLVQQQKRSDAIRLIRQTLHPFINKIRFCDKLVQSMYSALCYRIKHFNKN